MITILKDHLQRVRPLFVAARSYQRTTYLPGELGQFDWWHTGLLIPVGKGFRRQAYGLVASLPHSAAHAVKYTLGKTTADFLPAFAGCLERLGGAPYKACFDNDSLIVAGRQGGQAVFHPEIPGAGRPLRDPTDRAGTREVGVQGPGRADHPLP